MAAIDPQPFLQLEIDRLHQLLVLHWQGFVPSEEYQSGLTEAIQVSQKAGTFNWIMDMKRMKVIRQADQEWTLQTWFPQFQLLGVGKLAFVVSDDIFNQMAVSSMVAAIRPKFKAEVEYFQELASAVQWAQDARNSLSDLGLFSVK
ncbi:MAG: STAS/SEC14 domain-containing protein [Rufibacter sp.]